MNNKIDKRISINEKLYYKGLNLSKSLFHAIKPSSANKQVVFVLGCQRSGTCLMEKIFRKDFKTKTYPDFSILTDQSDPASIRLRPFPEVKKIFSSQKAELIVAKALIETQNANLLLDNFPGCKIIWMYRNYKAVAKSNISRFGLDNGRRDLAPILIGDKNNWRSENVSLHTRATIIGMFKDNISFYDAAALFWYARNILLYDLKLETNRNLLMVSYENLIIKPDDIMRRIYEFLRMRYPGQSLVKDIHTDALRRGEHTKLSPPVEKLCGDLYGRLEADCNQQEQIYLNKM